VSTAPSSIVAPRIADREAAIVHAAVRLTEPVLFGTLDWMLVYIDANLYDHIEKGDRMPPEHRVPAEHCAAFRDARLSDRRCLVTVRRKV